jgi:hypothetical protein
LATSATGDRSASCNIRTICSSVNLARFITAPQVRGAIVSKYPWSENPRTGQGLSKNVANSGKFGLHVLSSGLGSLETP